MDSSLFINGMWLPGDGPLMSSTNPSNSELLWQKNQASTQQVAAAIHSARQAFSEWKNTSEHYRIEIIRRFGELLQQQSEVLAIQLSKENGKPLWEARTEVSACIKKIDISITARQQRCHDYDDQGTGIQHKPLGIAAVIGPYNFPYHLPNGHIVPALLAGNCVIIKPSELVPYCTETMINLWHQAGLPKGVMNLLQGDAETSKALIRQDIDAVFFTGSSETGIAIHKALAGRPQTLLALEMGGNNPLIIDKPKHRYSLKDFQQLTDLIIRSAFISSGQRCTCSRRLILVKHEENNKLISVLVKRVKQLNCGPTNGEDNPIFIGPIISSKACRDFQDACQQRLDKGGRAIYMPEPAGNTALARPTIIDMTDVEKNKIDDLEIFGPLLQLYKVDTFRQAIDSANRTRYGLAAGLVSENKKHQKHFQQEMEAGFCVINKPTTGAPSTLPFGGTGFSGNHRPSAFYAADYCAWPQARTLSEKIQDGGEITQRHVESND